MDCAPADPNGESCTFGPTRMELKRQIEAMKREVARKEKKLKWLERVSKNRSSGTVVKHQKRKSCDGFQKDAEHEREESHAVDGRISNISSEHFKHECGDMLDESTCMDKIVASDEQLKVERCCCAHDQNACTHKMSPNMIVSIKDAGHKDGTKDEIKDNSEPVLYDKMYVHEAVKEQEIIIGKTNQEIILKTSTDTDEMVKKMCIESHQIKQSDLSEQINSTEVFPSNFLHISLNTPCRSTRSAKRKLDYSDLMIDELDSARHSIDKIDCEAISVIPNETQNNNENCLKNLFSILGYNARYLNNSHFVLPDEEYGSLKLEVLTEQPLAEIQNKCEQKIISTVTEEIGKHNQEVNKLDVESEISNTTGNMADHRFSDSQHSEYLISDSILALQEDRENTSCLNFSPQISEIKNSAHSTNNHRFLSPQSKDKESTLQSSPRIGNSKENRTMNYEISLNHSKEDSIMLNLIEKEVMNGNNTAKASMKLMFSLNTDIRETVEKINSYFIPKEQQQYILLQHVTKVSIWTLRNMMWFYKCTYTVDIGEKVLDSCLLHQNSSSYFAAALSHIDACVLNIYMFKPESKCLEKFFSQIKPFKWTNLCQLEDTTFAAAYALPDISTIFVYNIEGNVKDKHSTCTSHHLARVKDCIVSLITMDNLPHSLLCCGQQYIYIWNYLTNKLTCKIHIGKEISASICYRAYALKGLLFLIMMRRFKLKQQTELCLIALNPTTSKYEILRRYGSLKDHWMHSRLASAKGHYISILDGCELTVYNIFTAEEVANVKDCKAVSVSTINKLHVVMTGLNNGTIHCYQFL